MTGNHTSPNDSCAAVGPYLHASSQQYSETGCAARRVARCPNLHSAPHLHVRPQTCLLVSPSPSFPAYSRLVVLVLVAAPLLYWSAFAICAPTAYHHITLYVLHQAHRSFLNITTAMLAPPQLPHRTRTGLRPTDCLHHAAHFSNAMAYTQVAQATLKVPECSLASEMPPSVCPVAPLPAVSR